MLFFLPRKLRVRVIYSVNNKVYRGWILDTFLLFFSLIKILMSQCDVWVVVVFSTIMQWSPGQTCDFIFIENIENVTQSVLECSSCFWPALHRKEVGMNPLHACDWSATPYQELWLVFTNTPSPYSTNSTWHRWDSTNNIEMGVL